MTYRIQLFKLTYERQTLKSKEPVGRVFLTDHTLNGSLDDVGRIAVMRAGVSANAFHCDGYQSCRDVYHDDTDLPASMRHMPGKWEPVISGSI